MFRVVPLIYFLAALVTTSIHADASSINWAALDKENELSRLNAIKVSSEYKQTLADLKDIESKWLPILEDFQTEIGKETRRDLDAAFKKLCQEQVIKDNYTSFVVSGHRFWVPNCFLTLTKSSEKEIEALSSIYYGKAPSTPSNGSIPEGHHAAQTRYTPSNGGYIPDIIILSKHTHNNHHETLHLPKAKSGVSQIIRSEFAIAQKNLYLMLSEEILFITPTKMTKPNRRKPGRTRKLFEPVMHPYKTRLNEKRLSQDELKSEDDNTENDTSTVNLIKKLKFDESNI